MLGRAPSRMLTGKRHTFRTTHRLIYGCFLGIKFAFFGMADCFIIMPISTPENLVPAYGGDAHHFQHVLDCLFIPAVKKAGLNPIPPIAKGADVIQAGIVQNLEKNDLVLCDMSSLNANVFFELGIRTAIGKPVCVVKDDITQKVPFDMTVINYHTYASTLAPWSLEAEIEKLSSHITESVERCAGENLLWKYFSLSQRAQLPHPKPQDETLDRLALLSNQLEGLSRKFDSAASRDSLSSVDRVFFGNSTISVQTIIDELDVTFNNILGKIGANLDGMEASLVDRVLSIRVSAKTQLDSEIKRLLSDIAESRGFKLKILEPSQASRLPPPRPKPFQK